MSGVRLLVGDGEAAEAHTFSADAVVALLEAVGLHLEAGQGGSRFPLVWRLAEALVGTPEEWSAAELPAVLRELRALGAELEGVPARATPTFVFGDEGLPDVFSRETPSAVGSARSRFSGTLDKLHHVVVGAHNVGIRLVGEGPRVAWWDG